jgi:hypothetical protein
MRDGGTCCPENHSLCITPGGNEIQHYYWNGPGPCNP